MEKMVRSFNTKVKEETPMSRKDDRTYFERRPDIVKLFGDLEEYKDFCRFELREFNPAELYKKSSHNYRAYLASKKKNYKPRFNRRSNG